MKRVCVSGQLLVAAGLAMGALVGAADAGGPERSLRPVERPYLGPAQFASITVVNSVRPVMRPATLGQEKTQVSAEKEAAFQNWISGFKARARTKGLSSATLEQAFDGVRYDPEVIRRDQNQSEFNKTIWQYLETAASSKRVTNGQVALATYDKTLGGIEARYGVDREVVLAVWGMESNYGKFRGSMDVVRSLATLAFDGRRGAFFEQQLIAALKILQSGDVAPRKMTGSWAGAMGHTQFIPTSYQAYAVDYTGDGKRDIWSDDPSDALASTAAYLAKFGWVKGQPWGVEVTLPKGFDYRLANRKIKRSPKVWADLGVRGINGKSVPNYGKGSILLPAGGRGAAFMIFDNFAVIERYNKADAYVIGVGHLSDRIKGGPAIQGDWPKDDRALTLDERKEVQRRLTSKGFDTRGVDGRIGPNSQDAIRAFQVSEGQLPDGHASYALLKELR